MMQDPIYFRAPVIIFIVGNGPLSETACAFVAENCMLTATTLGLGSCWVEFGGLIEKDKECRKLIRLSSSEKIAAAIVVGFEEGSAPAVSRKKTRIAWI